MNKKIVVAFVVGYGVGRLRPRKINMGSSYMTTVLPEEIDDPGIKEFFDPLRKHFRRTLPFKETCEFPGCRWVARSRFPDDLPKLVKEHWEKKHPNLS